MPPATPVPAHAGPLRYSAHGFARAKLFVFERWCEMAALRQLAPPTDLSRACKYGSLFMQQVYGGAIRGHFEHQYNHIDGRLVDLSHDALDVGRMHHPYRHDADYFNVPEVQAALARCAPRTARWAAEFMSREAPATTSVMPPADGRVAPQA